MQHPRHHLRHEQSPPNKLHHPFPTHPNTSSGPSPTMPAAAPAGHHRQQQQQYQSWQSNKDTQHRHKMIRRIKLVLKRRANNLSPEWLAKLPRMSKMLEEILYRSAPSFDTYADTSTLDRRLLVLYMEITREEQKSELNPTQPTPTSGSPIPLLAVVPADHHHQQQQKQQFPSWQSNKDMQHRHGITQHIALLLKRRANNPSPEWLAKLPRMSTMLEERLYRSAPSFNTYADTSTLDHRLRILFMGLKEGQSRGSTSSNL